MFHKKTWVYMKVTHGGRNDGYIRSSKEEAQELMKADTNLDGYCRTYVYLVNDKKQHFTYILNRLRTLFAKIVRVIRDF